VADPVTLQGARRSYGLDSTRTNAMCRLEDATGLTYLELLERLARPRPPIPLLEQFLQAALVESLPLAELRSVLKDIGGRRVIRAAVQAALQERLRQTHG
jgi:hypothetical protein